MSSNNFSPKNLRTSKLRNYGKFFESSRGRKRALNPVEVPAKKSQEPQYCDCLSETCPGCHFPCMTCKGRKCGHICKRDKKHFVQHIEHDAKNLIIKNQFIK